MKNKATKFVAIFSLCALCLGGYAVSRISAGEPAVGDLPVEHLLGDFAIDVNDPYEVVGFADYYFLATVDEAVTTSYRNETTVESETGGTRKAATDKEHFFFGGNSMIRRCHAVPFLLYSGEKSILPMKV